MSETIEVWIVNSYQGSHTVDFLESQLVECLNAHPSLQIEWRLLTFANAWTELIRAYKNGNPPDVFEFGTTWFSTLAHLHLLSPVPAGIEEAPCIAPYLDQVRRYHGQAYAVPWTADTTCIMARTDVLSAMNLDPRAPLNWIEFRTVCQDIMANRQKSVPGQGAKLPRAITFPCRPERPTLHQMSPWLWGSGFEFSNFERAPVQFLSAPEFKRGITYIRDIMNISQMTVEDARNSTYESNIAFFQHSSTVFHVNSLYDAVRNIIDNPETIGPQLPTCIVPVPEGPAGSFSYGGGSLLGVSSTTKHADIAWDIVLALQSPRLVNNWARWTHALPAVECAFWEDYSESADIQVLRHNLNHSRIYPFHPMWSSIERVLSVSFGDVMWYLIEHDFDDQALALCCRADEEINRLLSLHWGIS